MIEPIKLEQHLSIKNWESLIRMATPDDEMVKELIDVYFENAVPDHCKVDRYARIVAMTAIYINSYKRNEALPEFDDKPNDHDEVHFVEWLSKQYGTPVYMP